MMGAGKTTVGKDLRSARSSLCGCDHEIVARTGVQIPVIFEIEGKKGSPARVPGSIRTRRYVGSFVIATGGGIVPQKKNRKRLREHAFVVLIEVSPEILWERTRQRPQPALLAGSKTRASEFANSCAAGTVIP